MSKIIVKNLTPLKLTDLLKRRKKNLEEFLNESGITTYESLKERCSRMGVQAPHLSEWESIRVDFITSPTEGIIVLDPMPVIKESSGEEILVEELKRPEIVKKKKGKGKSR